MFSYTDDAIVTSSPTGRHLSTVIRRPAAIDPLDWNEHAEQVCKVLNELKAGDALIDAGKIASDYQSRSWTLYPGVQMVGRVKREEVCVPYSEFQMGAHVQVEATGGARKEMYADTLAGDRIAELEKQLDDAATKLAAAQMLLEQAVELPIETAVLRVLLENVGTGSLLDCKAPCGRTVIIKRVE